MKTTVIRNIAVLLVVAFVCIFTGRIYLQQQQPDELYTGNPNITSVIKLSDYNENLKGTVNDVDIYVFDSGVPGGKALIYGGTHTNEVGSMLNAVTYLENVKCEAGTIYVMVHANNSGYTHTQPLRAQIGSMDFTLTDGSTRSFHVGTRISNPIHQWPDPNYHFNSSGRRLIHDELAEIRNLNRNHPGEKNGYLTEATCYAIWNFIVTEGIDMIFDGHEAGAESTNLVNTLVIHERAMTLGTTAVTNCLINNLPFKVEISGITSYGLSHRGIGDNTNALCTLFETCNPAMGSLHEKMTEKLFKEGISQNYYTLHQNGVYGNAFVFDETGWPIEKRTAYQMNMSMELLNTFSELYPDKPIKVSGLPDAQYMLANGLEATLKSLT